MKIPSVQFPKQFSLVAAIYTKMPALRKLLSLDQKFFSFLTFFFPTTQYVSTQQCSVKVQDKLHIVLRKGAFQFSLLSSTCKNQQNLVLSNFFGKFAIYLTLLQNTNGLCALVTLNIRVKRLHSRSYILSSLKRV